MKTLTKMLVLTCWCLCFVSVALSDDAADKIALENERLLQQQQIDQAKIDYYNNLNTENSNGGVPASSSSEDVRTGVNPAETSTEVEEGPLYLTIPNNNEEVEIELDNSLNPEKEAYYNSLNTKCGGS